MRLLLSIFTMVFIVVSFLYSSQVIHAEKANNQRKEANMFLWADEQQKFIAELPVTKETKGTWVYYFDGKQIGSQTNAPQSISFTSPAYVAGTPHTVKVTFHGQMMGQELFSSQEIHLPRINIKYNRIKETEQFSMRFSNVSKVEGKMGIIIRDEDGKLVDLCNSLFYKDFTFNCKLPLLDEGKYTVSFLFSGTFDNMYAFASYGFMQNGVFTVNDSDEPGILQLQKPENSPSNDQIRKLIQEADKTKWDTTGKANYQYMVIIFILIMVILFLIRIRLKLLFII